MPVQIGTKPRASTEICTKILQSMIIQYAPAITSMMSDKMLREYDVLIKRAGRVGLHAPKTTSGQYVNEILNLKPSKDKLHQMAANYIQNEARCPTIKNIVNRYKTPITKLGERRATKPVANLISYSQGQPEGLMKS